MYRLVVANVSDMDRLIEDHADPNTSANDTTPLILTSSNGNLAAVTLLCDVGAAKDLAKNDGATPLITASHHGHGGMVKLLCDADAAKDQAGNTGCTPLCMASQNSHVEAV